MNAIVPAQPAGLAAPAPPGVNLAALPAGLAALDTDLAQARALQVTTPEAAQVVGEILIERLREYDVIKAERDRVTKPIHAAWKQACDWFKPHVDGALAVCDALKAALGQYELAQRKIKAAALEIAQEQIALLSAPEPGPAPAESAALLTEALTLANQSETRAEGVGAKFVWRPVKYKPEVMAASGVLKDQDGTPLPGLVPDEKACAAYARAWKDEKNPPVIPGVLFELQADITGRRA